MTDREFMNIAVDEAKKAGREGEVAVGAVIARNKELLCKGHNQRQSKKSIVSHAEIEAITLAEQLLNRWQLDDCTLYVTLEPCVMCAGAIISARIKRVVFGAYDYNFGAFSSKIDLTRYDFKPMPEVQCGFMEDECSSLLTEEFKKFRKTGE